MTPPDLVTRQLALEEGSNTAEAERLSRLLGMQGSLPELNRTLADRIAKGELDLRTPGLADHLWQTTMDKLAGDQTNYASYKREREGKGSKHVIPGCAVRRRPGISRFRVRRFASPRNDGERITSSPTSAG